jgi:hypothetical protein
LQPYQSASQQQRCIDKRTLSAQLTDMSMHARTHARLVFFFFYLVFYLACFDSVRPASPARLSFHDAFSHRLFLAIPKPCFVPLVYPLHTKENLSGAV